MRIGAVFPQTEAGKDSSAIKDYAQAVESMGLDHILAFDHILGANTKSRPEWKGTYQLKDSFYEPFVLFSYIAGITKKIELATGVIILPQRQTALVAKQAATVDLLSNGRLRLGVGIGWNSVEYEALGENFTNRGKRSEEQVELLKALWSEESITFEGKYHRITDAGLNPLPFKKSIPIWFGGAHELVLKRIAKIGDGWMAVGKPDDSNKIIIDKLTGYLKEENRSIDDIGIESVISLKGLSDKDIEKEISDWSELGATHFSVNTMNNGMQFPDDHIKAISKFLEIIRA